jgi:hypothetical protein
MLTKSQARSLTEIQRARLMLEVANQHKTQEEIANIVNAHPVFKHYRKHTQVSVSRLVNDARDENVVSVRIQPPRLEQNRSLASKS